MIEIGQQLIRVTAPLDPDCPLKPGDIRTLRALIQCKCGFIYVDVGLDICGSQCEVCGTISKTTWLSPIEYWKPYNGAKIISIYPQKKILEQSKD